MRNDGAPCLLVGTGFSLEEFLPGLAVIIAACQISPSGLPGAGGDDEGALLLGLGAGEVEKGSRGEWVDVVIEDKDVSAGAHRTHLAGSLHAQTRGCESGKGDLRDLGSVACGEFGDGGDFITRAEGRGFLWDETGDVLSAPKDLGIPGWLDLDEVVGLFFSELIFRDHRFVENDFDDGLRIDGSAVGMEARRCVEAGQGEEEEKSFHGLKV